MAFLEALFRLVLSLSFAGGAGTLLVLGAKALWKDRPGPRWNYYVWALPLVLYVVPFSFSLPLPGAGTGAAGASSGGVSAGAGASAASQALQGTEAAPGLLELAAAWWERLLPVLAWVWALGAAFSLAVRLADSRSLRRALGKCALPCTPGGRAEKAFHAVREELGIPLGRVEPAVCPGVGSPLLLGLCRPRVVIPREDLEDSRLEMIFRHELTHFRSRDLWFKAAALAVAAVHWFDPLARLMLRDLDRSCELCCDWRTTRGMSPAGRRRYGRMLLDVAQGVGDGPAPAQGVYLAMEKKELRRRLAQLRAPGRTTLLDRAVALALCLVAASVGVVCSSASNPGPVFRELLPGVKLAAVEIPGEEEIPALWSGEAAQPETIPRPNPTDVPRQEPLKMQVVLSDEAQAAVDAAEAEKAAQAAAEAEAEAAAAAETAGAGEAAEGAEEAPGEELEEPGEEPAGDPGEGPEAKPGEEPEEEPEEEPQEEPDEEEAGGEEALSWDGSFIWPVNGGYITCGFYGYYGHNAVDIAADSGTEIYAAASGVVTFASDVSVWPYGKSVLLDHGDGVTTRYAHCSRVLVSEGDYVERGQVIALVGRTGNASGDHCHFEVKIGGVPQDPTAYIGATRP